MTNKTTYFVLQNVTNKPDWLVKPLLYHFKPVYQSAVHNILVIHKATTVQAAKAAGMMATTVALYGSSPQIVTPNVGERMLY